MRLDIADNLAVVRPCVSRLLCDGFSTSALSCITIAALAAVLALCAGNGKSRKSQPERLVDGGKAGPSSARDGCSTNGVNGVNATDRAASFRLSEPDAVVVVQVVPPARLECEDVLPHGGDQPAECTSIKEVHPAARTRSSEIDVLPDCAEPSSERFAPETPHDSSSLGRSSGEASTSELVLTPRDMSLEGLHDYLQLVVEKAGGTINAKRYTIDGTQPFRVGLFTVQCRCKTQYGKPVEAMFFASRTAWQRQCEMLSMSCIRASGVDVRDKLDASVHDVPASRLKITAPCRIITDTTQPLDDALKSLPLCQLEVTVAAVASQLAAQLARLHRRRWVLCGVARRNVVLLDGAVSPTYTFRELASSRPEGHKTEGRNFGGDVRLLPPEVAHARLSGRPTAISPAIDVWQLGVLLFELYTGSSYWPPGECDDGVLAALTGALPHELNSSALDAAVESGGNHRRQALLVAKMLSRDPAARPTMADVEHKLQRIVGVMHVESSASISMRSLPTGPSTYLTA